MTTVMDPIRLAGLKQATYVMDSLVKGYTEEEITKILGGDAQLVKMWILFLKYNQWIEATMEGWDTTSKGLEWSKRLASKEVKPLALHQ
jgi:hypothetical protein